MPQIVAALEAAEAAINVPMWDMERYLYQLALALHPIGPDTRWTAALKSGPTEPSEPSPLTGTTI
jgi:hypothetical protein